MSNILHKLAAEFDAEVSSDSLTAANAIDMALRDSPDITRVASLLAAFAAQFDTEGRTKVANLLEYSLEKLAAEKEDQDDPRSRESLYSTEKNRDKHFFVKPEKMKSDPVKPNWSGLGGHADTLSTRHSPDMPGVQLTRLSDGVYQDPITKKVYDFNRGWVSDDGRAQSGGSISHQTPVAGDWLRFRMPFENK